MNKNDNSKINIEKKRHVFIIGSKGIPAKYGGFETFVDNLTFRKKTLDIQYHVSCMVDTKEYNSSKKKFIHNNAECVNIEVKDIGAVKAIVYDINSLKYFIKYVKDKNIENPIFYILACRIGPCIGYFKKEIEKLGGHLYINPDGHEWKRAKWSWPVRAYWKLSERLMVKNAELIICDSKNIEKYIKKIYKNYNPNTTFIPYGAETSNSNLKNNSFQVEDWYSKNSITPKEYYLVVGRFVPENNYEIMIREFMESKTKKDFVLITDIKGSKFYEKLKIITKFNTDNRIKFVGTVYDYQLLKKIRQEAYGYLHGHEVGGTNPSLLESLSSTELNMLLDVGFNREVGENGALYWDKKESSLANLISKADEMSSNEINLIGKLARRRIAESYNWQYVVEEYENLFLNI